MQNAPSKIFFKRLIKQACTDLLLKRISAITGAMDLAQESANSDNKSSVGDKHETSRAKSQADRDMNAAQLLEARKDLDFIAALNVEQTCSSITNGCLFELQGQLFFVALGLGSIEVDHTKVMVISYLSPLFTLLRSKKNGDQVLFQNKAQVITEVC